MNLEKTVKTAFENFEPEVNPSVWSHLEQNLKQAPVSTDPSGASVSAGKTAVKVLSGNISPWVWVAGFVTTASIITALVFISAEKKVSTPLPQQALPIGQTSTSPTNSFENKPASDQMVSKVGVTNEKAVSPPKNEIKKAVKTEVPATSLPVSSDKEKTNANDINNAEQRAGKTQSSITENEAKAADNHPIADKPNNSEKVNTDILPVIILNAHAGFAPLKVTALLNGQELKGNWDFGDGQPGSSGNTVTHSFTKQGTYKLTCTIGEKIIEKEIEVIGSVSTGFTPNGDGVNDEFHVDSDQLTELNVKIMDRSGKQVFAITQPGQNWDGRDSRGKNLPDGTYFYNIFARSNNGQPINQKGTISIFR